MYHSLVFIIFQGSPEEFLNDGENLGNTMQILCSKHLKVINLCSNQSVYIYTFLAI